MHGIVKSSLSPPQSTSQQAIHSSLSLYRRNPLSEMTSRCSISSSKEVPLFQTLKGIQQLAETRRFKLLRLSSQKFHLPNVDGLQAWFLDQFGVLHDGKQPYPGAISTCRFSSVSFGILFYFLTVERLATSGAKMVVISNSSRRASITMEKLKTLGFDPSLFLGAITSGELTHQYLQSDLRQLHAHSVFMALTLNRRNDAWFAALGRSCIHMTWNDRGAISLEGLGLQVVDKVDEAEFILAHGTEALGLPSGTSLPLTLEDLEEILKQCAVKNIPMVVANPDFVTVEARALRVMPGTLASKYEKLGGEVKWMGKPDEKIYKSAMAMAGVDAVDCIAVGDSLHHDIKGANIAGIQSAFITCGIHATELGLGKFGDAADSSSVQALALTHDAHPSYVLPAFMW
ncbi:hypothetical protein RHSIM_Rhsim02G0085900 [Rhododendron simsii]|uniref:Uncharacterized protein n=1 Tax=Rhododendron simsii TaxID=118357 RepID=A0A834HBX1_RHOSS|nr:hypothetical protein RHSIM_Rhsim02G0085900 [Rhododendron simsii]